MTDQNKNVAATDETTELIRRSALTMQRYALPPALILAIAAIAVGVLFFGISGLIATLFATLITIGGGLLVLWVMRKVAHLPTNLVLGVALCTFLGKIIFLLVFALIFRHTTLFDSTLFAVTVVAGLLAWSTGEFVGFRKTKMPSVVPAESQAG